MVFFLGQMTFSLMIVLKQRGWIMTSHSSLKPSAACNWYLKPVKVVVLVQFLCCVVLPYQSALYALCWPREIPFCFLTMECVYQTWNAPPHFNLTEVICHILRPTNYDLENENMFIIVLLVGVLQHHVCPLGVSNKRWGQEIGIMSDNYTCNVYVISVFSLLKADMGA